MDGRGKDEVPAPTIELDGIRITQATNTLTATNIIANIGMNDQIMQDAVINEAAARVGNVEVRRKVDKRPIGFHRDE